LRWTVVEKMVWAWILTIPVSGGIAWLLVEAGRLLGWMK
jgi:inorganic phosphate transporter, PiT family